MEDAGKNWLATYPRNWNEFYKWVEQANENVSWGYEVNEYGSASSHECPVFTGDCGYKLDFDGPLMSFSSRFYPPHKYGKNKWGGSMHIRLMNDEIVEKKFEEDNFRDLTNAVIKYTEAIGSEFSQLLADNMEILKGI